MLSTETKQGSRIHTEGHNWKRRIWNHSRTIRKGHKRIKRQELRPGPLWEGSSSWKSENRGLATALSPSGAQRRNGKQQRRFRRWGEARWIGKQGLSRNISIFFKFLFFLKFFSLFNECISRQLIFVIYNFSLLLFPRTLNSTIYSIKLSTFIPLFFGIFTSNNTATYKSLIYNENKVIAVKY